MSRWHGKYGKGARKELREVMRVEAEERNAATPDDRRRANRPHQAVPAVSALSARRVVCRRRSRPRPHFVWHATAKVGATR